MDFGFNPCYNKPKHPLAEAAMEALVEIYKKLPIEMEKKSCCCEECQKMARMMFD